MPHLAHIPILSAYLGSKLEERIEAKFKHSKRIFFFNFDIVFSCLFINT